METVKKQAKGTKRRRINKDEEKPKEQPQESKDMVNAFVYERQAQTYDPAKTGHVQYFQEIWVGEPYNICINRASKCFPYSEQIPFNVLKRDQPLNKFFPSFGKPSITVEKTLIQVPKKWVDECFEILEKKQEIEAMKTRMHAQWPLNK